MFGSRVRFPVVTTIDYDPAADKAIPIWRVPIDCEVKSAYVMLPTALAADGTNYYSLTLRNGGALGTATTAVSDTLAGTAGLTANVPHAFTMSTSNFSAGDVIQVAYDENGTGTFGAMTIQLDVVYGT